MTDAKDGEADVPPPLIQDISVAAVPLDAEPRSTSEPDWGMGPRAEKLLWLGAGGLVVIGVVAYLLRRASRWWLSPERCWPPRRLRCRAKPRRPTIR